MATGEGNGGRKQALLTEGLWLGGVVLVLTLILPLILSDFRLTLLGRFLALAIVALGIDLIWGFTGLLSLGHGIFFALGGYALAMHLNLQLPAGQPAGQLPEFFTLYGVSELPGFWQPFYSFPFTLGAIVVLPLVVAAILGYLVFRNRIRGVYFSILTQAALVVFFNLFNGQQKLINGTNGLKTSTQFLFGQEVGSPEMQFQFYVLTVLMLAVIYILCRGLTSGRFGRLLVAIRDDESRVRFSGYNPTLFKVVVFAVSGAMAGIAGALYTVQSGIVSPQYMDIAFSIEMVIWVAVGGRATLVGAIVGAVAVNYGRSLLSEKFPEVWLFFQGALFLLVVTVLPDGVVGWLRFRAWDQVTRLLGRSPYTSTYPGLDLNEAVIQEKKQFEEPKDHP
ncbi:urea ABC transporter permease [Prochlorothrix hollandica PCC 9006 = CALU 1027]|uniref:Urea ABC transporter permease n=2 Tax=Prochlorothrix hollandica TaxID=1223 RepID=A0A0M2PYE6_PROHO|nr:urea ABC transporter permease [Prochlorothrix hollandica PCC 9006 = CALU 1027]